MVTFDSPKARRPNACLCQRETFSPQKLHGATAGTGQSANGIRQSESFLFAPEGPAGAEFALLFAARGENVAAPQAKDCARHCASR
jgi:hypothetical protein